MAFIKMEEAMKKIFMIYCLAYIALMITSQTVFAEEKVKSPPLPLQNVEGFGGILLTGSAYLINTCPLVVNAGFRFTESVQINLPGFAVDRETVLKGNSGVLNLGNCVTGGEYGVKPGEYDKIDGLAAERKETLEVQPAQQCKHHILVALQAGLTQSTHASRVQSASTQKAGNLPAHKK